MITIFFQLLIAAIVIGVVIWLAQMIPGIDPTFVRIVRVIAIVIFVVYCIYILMEVFGGGYHVPAIK